MSFLQVSTQKLKSDLNDFHHTLKRKRLECVELDDQYKVLYKKLICYENKILHPFYDFLFYILGSDITNLCQEYCDTDYCNQCKCIYMKATSCFCKNWKLLIPSISINKTCFKLFKRKTVDNNFCFLFQDEFYRDMWMYIRDYLRNHYFEFTSVRCGKQMLQSDTDFYLFIFVTQTKIKIVFEEVKDHIGSKDKIISCTATKKHPGNVFL